MRLKVDPISIVIISVLLGWGWMEVTAQDTCQITEQITPNLSITDTYTQEYCDKLRIENEDIQIRH